MSTYDWVFWLNVTNVALGVVVVLALVLLAYGVIWELLIRNRKRSGLHELDKEMQASLPEELSHSLPVPDLGLTMADGGEHFKSTAEKPAPETKSK